MPFVLHSIGAIKGLYPFQGQTYVQNMVQLSGNEYIVLVIITDMF